MDFTFSDEQLLFQESVREFLINEVTPERIRGNWATDTGREKELWQQLAELGLSGFAVPEEQGGLGLNELDFVLIAQECGYVALPEPLVLTQLVAVPLLKELGGPVAERWLPQIAEGNARVVVGLDQNLLVEDAHVADLLLLEKNGALYAVTPEQITLRHNESVDPSRRLYAVNIGAEVTPVATGDVAAKLTAQALDRGALGCAAQAIGLTQRMLDLTVQYTNERHQFGKPIGSFQAVKHLLADVAVQLEFARAPVHRAAYAVAHNKKRAGHAVSHAKIVASAATALAAKNCIQAHGAMGYTWEVDLHIFMKKGWALANTWGDVGFHKQRIADNIFSDDFELGAAATFS